MERVRKSENDAEGGFVLVKVMMAMMISLMLVSSLLSVSRMEYRRTLAGVRKREAHYASLTAVRLMAAGVVSGEWGWTEDILDAELVFVSADGEKEVTIPVQIWCGVDGDTMLLSARSGIDETEDGISLILQLEDGTWIPERYAFGWKNGEDAA